MANVGENKDAYYSLNDTDVGASDATSTLLKNYRLITR